MSAALLSLQDTDLSYSGGSEEDEPKVKPSSASVQDDPLDTKRRRSSSGGVSNGVKKSKLNKKKDAEKDQIKGAEKEGDKDAAE
jgi:hypothetical protein